MNLPASDLRQKSFTKVDAKVGRKLPPLITQLSSWLRVANKEGMMFLDFKLLALACWSASDIGGSSRPPI